VSLLESRLQAHPLSGCCIVHVEQMSDFQDGIDISGRAYVHSLCGGVTRVSGGDFLDICDPFVPCAATYCCECAESAPLSDVRWTDTGESIFDYRARLLTKTPKLLRVWHYGVGILVGAALGSTGGLVVGLVNRVPQNKIGMVAALSGLVGAGVCYFLGTFILKRFFRIDFCRMR
jgi:Predicted transmembrane sensor domain